MCVVSTLLGKVATSVPAGFTGDVSEKMTFSWNVKGPRNCAEWNDRANTISRAGLNRSTFKVLSVGSIVLKNSMLSILKVAIRHLLSRSSEMPCRVCLEPMSHNWWYSAFWTYDRNITAGVAVLKTGIMFAIWWAVLSRPGWGSRWLKPWVAHNYSVAQKPTSRRESCLCLIWSLNWSLQRAGAGRGCMLPYLSLSCVVWSTSVRLSAKWNEWVSVCALVSDSS